MWPYSGDVPADPPNIVSFASPPVAEVVTSVKFPAMSPETFTALGALRESAWAEEFPTLQQQPPYEAPVERFDAASLIQRPFTFDFETTPPLPRLWMISQSGNELIQVQSDWFAANWRRNAFPGLDGAEDAEYVRWPARRDAFIRHWGALSTWLRARDNVAVPMQCEVTYINHILPIEGVWSTLGEIGAVLPALAVPSRNGTQLENVAWRSASLRPASDGLAPSRLHISANPGFAGPGPEPSPVVILELTVRGAPPEDGDLLRFFDMGRKTIVETFLAITSDSAREVWGQQ
jgi:uncharacterized protein (TIGR04255 family)